MTPDPDEVAASLGGAVAEAEPSAEPETAPGGPPARDPDMMARALGGTIAPTAPPPAAAAPQLPAPDPAQSRQLMTSEGLYDIPAITHFLNTAGFGAQAPGLVSSAEKINDAVTKHQEAQQKLQISKITALGFMAQGWVKAMDAGVPADRALDMVASPAVASGTISMNDYMAQRHQLLALSPEQQRAVATSMMDQAAQYHKPTEVPEGGTLYDIFQRKVAMGQPKAPSAEEIKVALLKDAATVGTPNETPTAQLSKSMADRLIPPPHMSDAERKDLAYAAYIGKPGQALTFQDRQQMETLEKDAANKERFAEFQKQWDYENQHPHPPSTVVVTDWMNKVIQGQAAPDAPLDPATMNVPDKVTGMTPADVDERAVTAAMTGKVPSAGMGSGGLRLVQQQLINNRAAALAKAAGVNMAVLQQEYNAQSKALDRLVPLYANTASFANTATDNLNLALQQSGEVARTGSKFANRYLQWVQGNLTPAEGLTKFETYVYTAAREYAKVTQGSAMSAQGLTDTAQREASKLLNTAQSPQAFAAAVTAMKNDMGNVIRNQTQTINGLSATTAKFLQATRGPRPDAAPGSASAAANARVAQAQEALRSKAPGKRYTLTDGTVWDKNADGSVKQVQ